MTALYFWIIDQWVEMHWVKIGQIHPGIDKAKQYLLAQKKTGFFRALNPITQECYFFKVNRDGSKFEVRQEKEE